MTAISPIAIPEFDAVQDELAQGETAVVTLATPRRVRRRRLVSLLAVAATVFTLGGSAVVMHKGPKAVKNAVMRKLGLATALVQPHVGEVRPGEQEGVISCDSFFAADVVLPHGHPVDPNTVNEGSVRLIRRGETTPIPARVNTSAAGDSIVLTPLQPLEPHSYYFLQILPALKDVKGTPFKQATFKFTTGGAEAAVTAPIAFEQVALPQTANQMYTGVTVGPDGKLYACTYTGSIFRFDLNSDGTIAGTTEIKTMFAAHGGPRLITGITFDPAAPKTAPVLYVSHGQCTHENAADWTGAISRLSGSDFSKHEALVVGLPRAFRDHLNNQMAFGPDGALYFAQGSNSAMGLPDGPWGNRPERKLTATVLRVDLARLNAGPLPLNVKTEEGGTYNPASADAAVTIYATGVRNAYDLVWHTNGRLYAPINGSGAGGNVPSSPAGLKGISNCRLTVADHLADVRPGGYHGHPNPTRGQYVLMGGNPTGPTAERVSEYPAGTNPESNWRAPAMSFGRNLSPCGMIEFRGEGATAMLNGALMVCRYSGGKDICIVVPNADGSVKEMITGVEGLTRFHDPLDLAQHPTTGHLYVAELGGKRLTLVRAKAGGESARVYRTPITPAEAPAVAEAK